ncbi:MAG TPA: hypothetical protein VKU39_20960 [Streptosporangiaceae bacterium]|nr:hypothetical protein [Streptosporangiaceae bacterium]
MSFSIQEADLESNLADLRGIPLTEIPDMVLADTGTIPDRDEVSAFNSSI